MANACPFSPEEKNPLHIMDQHDYYNGLVQHLLRFLFPYLLHLYRVWELWTKERQHYPLGPQSLGAGWPVGRGHKQTDHYIKKWERWKTAVNSGSQPPATLLLGDKRLCPLTLFMVTTQVGVLLTSTK